jgi:HEAT repeat protein
MIRSGRMGAAALAAATALAGVALLGAGRGGGAGLPAATGAERPAAIAPQEGTAAAFLDGLAGTPPVACELVLHALGNRWGSGSVRPRVHAPLGAPAGERALAEWARAGQPAARDAPALLAALAHADPCVARVAARLLGTLDDAGTRARVRERARTASGTGRLAALVALAHQDDAEAVPVLEAALADADPEVRRAAAWALAGTEDARAVTPLTTALRDADPALRENAAWALGRIGRRQALGSLTAALGDGTVGVRVNAAWALGELEHADAIPALASLLADDGDVEVRRAAAWALGRIER